MRFRGMLLVGIVVTILAGCAGAVGTGKPTIQNAWARPGSAGQSSAVYFMIDNSSGSSDHLIGAASPTAESAELDRSLIQNNVMRMELQDSIEIPAGKSVEFKPGGYHVMLTGLTRDLKAGETFELALKFAKAGEVAVTVNVSE